jgi:hypothetical protein
VARQIHSICSLIVVVNVSRCTVRRGIWNMTADTVEHVVHSEIEIDLDVIIAAKELKKKN